MLLRGIILLSAVLTAVICAVTGAFSTYAWLWVLPVGFIGSFLVLFALAFLFLWAVCQLVDQSKPQEQDSPFYRKLARIYVDSIMLVLQCRLHIEGLEQLPQNGRFLLVCNHLSNMDPVVLLHVFKNYQLAFISKRENSTMFIVGKLMHKLQCQLINRENDREALKTILKCVSIINEDKASIAVFPEGYTSLDGLLHHFRCGVFKIAQKTHVPIVVCTLRNSQHVFHNALRLKPTAVDLHICGVIAPEQDRKMTATEIGQQAYRMMAADLGPDLVAENP